MSEDSLIKLNAEMVMLFGQLVNEIQNLKDRVSELESQIEDYEPDFDSLADAMRDSHD